MTTYKFLASDSASAMEEVVKKLGPDALIISTSKKGNKVEIEATNNLSNHQKQKDITGNFSDMLHSKIDFLREKQRNRIYSCLLYTSPSPRDTERSRMPSSA